MRIQGHAFPSVAALTVAVGARVAEAAGSCTRSFRFESPANTSYGLDGYCMTIANVANDIATHCGAHNLHEEGHSAGWTMHLVQSWFGTYLYRANEQPKPIDGAFEACLWPYCQAEGQHQGHLAAIIIPSVVGGVAVILGVTICALRWRRRPAQPGAPTIA